MSRPVRNRTKREVLLPGDGPPVETLAALCRACQPALAARLWATCRWPGTLGEDWDLGDFNYLVLSATPEADCSLFVQFWSEPLEPAQVEVTSGEWNPGAVKYLPDAARTEIERRGFAVGGRARNYRNAAAITSAAEAAVAAREALAIFFEAFGYRGQWPLEVEWSQGQRSESQHVHEAVAPEDVAKLAEQVGLRVTTLRDDPPLLGVRRGRRRFVMALAGRVPEHRLYRVVLLDTSIVVPPTLPDTWLEQLQAELPLMHLARRGPFELRLAMVLRLQGGVTTRWLGIALEHFLAEWRLVARRVRKATVPGRPVSAPPALVH